MAETYYGKAPADAETPGDAWLMTWLKCATCGKVTAHALILDAARERGHLESGCHGEMANRRVDRARRQVHRLLAGLAAQGIEVSHRPRARMQLDDSAAEVLEFSDSGVQIRVCDEIPPDEAFEALRQAELIVDELDLLGRWTTGKAGRRWRGVAIRS